MRSLADLINLEEPGLPIVERWVASSAGLVEVLRPSPQNAEVLLWLQVTTRSPLGAVAYGTGGILVDGGWLRVLGSGHERLTRDLASWNVGRSSGFLLVADDIAGGFFALNGGTLGDDAGNIYYFAPDTLNWEPLGIGYSAFLEWAMSERLDQFYESLRWPTWRSDVANLGSDQCISFAPPLFTAGVDATTARRRAVSILETWELSMDIKRQLDA